MMLSNDFFGIIAEPAKWASFGFAAGAIYATWIYEVYNPWMAKKKSHKT